MVFRRQALSLLLALVFLLTLVPGSAFAAELEDEDVNSDPVEIAVEPEAGETQTFDSALTDDDILADDTELPDEDDEVLEEGEDIPVDVDVLPEEIEETLEEEEVEDVTETIPVIPAQPVAVYFSCEEDVDLRNVFVFDAEGKPVDPLYDEVLEDYRYGVYLLLPGTYSYSFLDEDGLFEAIEGNVFTVEEEAEDLEIALELTQVQEEPTEVLVSFVCAEADLAALTLRDADGEEVKPLYDDEAEAPVYGAYLLTPGEYTYSYHDENGKYKDLEESLTVDGSEDQEISLTLSPVVQGMCFSGSFINPIYADVIDESDLPEVAISPEESLARLQQAVSPSPSLNGRRTRKFLAAPAVPIYSDLEAAGLALKQEILKRNETITLRLITDIEPGDTQEEQEETWAALCYFVYAEAIRHNGTPTEGDYIRYEYGGANFTGSILSAEQEGYYYYEFVYAPLYFTTLAQEQELDAKVSSILASLDLNNHGDYDKMKAIYDYICSHVSYNYGSDNIKFTAYSALINGSAVCQGYSVALYRLCLAAGIDARVVTSESLIHAWNIVCIDGSKYYYVDSTWDAEQYPGDYLYFLKGSKNWGGKHTAGDEFGELAEVYGFDQYSLSADDYVAPGAVIHKASVVFDGLIRIKYYFDYTQSLLNQRGAYVAFFQDGEEVSRAPLNAVKDNEGLYSQYFNVFVKDLSKDVTVRVFDSFGNPVPMTSKSGKTYPDGVVYSAITYAKQIQSSGNSAIKALGKALEDYGTAAQIYFKSGNYQGLSASSEVKAVKVSDLERYALKTSGTKPAGITKTKISVMFEADNSLRIYFTYDGSKDPGAYTYKIDGNPAQILRRGDGEYYITYQNIAAQDLEVAHTFTVSDGVNTFTATTSVLGYAHLVIQTNDVAAQDLGKSLYLYNLAAEQYFSNT